MGHDVARLARKPAPGVAPAARQIHGIAGGRIVQGVLITLPDGSSQDSDLCALQYVEEIFAAHKLYTAFGSSRMTAAGLNALAARLDTLSGFVQDPRTGILAREPHLPGKIATLKKEIVQEAIRLSPPVVQQQGPQGEFKAEEKKVAAVAMETMEEEATPWPGSIQVQGMTLTLVQKDHEIIYENEVKSGKAGHFHVTIHQVLPSWSDWKPKSHPFSGRYYISKKKQVGAKTENGVTSPSGVVRPDEQAAVLEVMALTAATYQALQG